MIDSEIIKFQNFFLQYTKDKKNKVEALSNLNISIYNEEHIAVIGPSGSGKTSFLKSIVFALRPSSGKLLFENINPWSMSSKKRHKLRSKIFISSQVPHLPPRQKVLTAVLAGKLAGMNSFMSLVSLIYPQDIDKVKYALDCFGLGAKLYERVDRLSGGERQRISLARAILSQSKLWAIDEPLASLDPMRAEESLINLKQIALQRNVTFIASLHQTNFALKHFSRIIGIKKGKIYFDYSPSKIHDDLIKDLYSE